MLLSTAKILICQKLIILSREIPLKIMSWHTYSPLSLNLLRPKVTYALSIRASSARLTWSSLSPSLQSKKLSTNLLLLTLATVATIFNKIYPHKIPLKSRARVVPQPHHVPMTSPDKWHKYLPKDRGKKKRSRRWPRKRRRAVESSRFSVSRLHQAKKRRKNLRKKGSKKSDRTRLMSKGEGKCRRKGIITQL